MAVDRDGGAAVALGSVDGKAPGSPSIAILDPVGAPKQSIGIEGYVPVSLAFAPDRSVWSIGGPGLTGDPPHEYAMLRHDSREGRELGRYL